MKKFYKLMTFLLVAVAITACSKNEEEADLTQRIPDPQFKEYLINSFDVNTDFKLSKAEIEHVVIIRPYSYPQIRSVQGIDIFTNLEEFSIIESKLESIDLSRNLKIRKVGCARNLYLKTVYLPKAVEKLCTIVKEEQTEVIFK